MSSLDKTVSWCSVRSCPPSPPSVNTSEITFDSEYAEVGNGSNKTCTTHGYPFCVNVLTKTINDSNVRVYDLILVFFNTLFLLVLLIRMVPTIKKLIRSFPLFKMLYSMVFVIPIMSLFHGVLSMALSYKHTSAKVTQVLVRGSILMTEISVIVFGLFFKSYAEQLMRLCFTVFVIIVLSTVFTLAEGLSEFLRENKLACHELQLFTHGGMLFLFTTSVIFASVYFLIFVMYMLGLSKRWNFPSKKSFYRYAFVLSLVNLLQAIGSVLWYTGEDRKGTGSAGICITTATTFIYLTTFAPVVYWIFLKNYFRMNKPKQSGGSAINTSSEEKTVTPSRRSSNLRFSKPTLISKRSSYFEEQRMIEGDLDSSVSSYGSFRDEEIFSTLIK